MTPELRRVFAHEITHACLSMLGRWPAWLQEGLAQKLSGESLSPADREKLAALAREHKLPQLSTLGQDWSRMDAGRAATAYALSLAAAESLYENYHEWGVRSLVQSPERLAAVTADLDKRLGLEGGGLAIRRRMTMTSCPVQVTGISISVRTVSTN